MKRLKPCPICASEYTLFVQKVIGQRTPVMIDQFFCMDCRSFFNHSGYRETDEQKRRDFDFLMTHAERHRAILGQLCLEIITKAPHIRTMCEIGFGAGFLMEAFRNFGRETYGFEVNLMCFDHARDVLGLPCENLIFDRTHERKYDALVACMVFEHLEDPRALFAEMRDHLNPDGVIYISVPFVERRDWPCLWTADSAPGEGLPDPFFDNEVHINHFSMAGMEMMGRQLGARSVDFWSSQDVYDKSPGSYPGVLFRF
jgi:SAM-dependent methyltransferase